MRAEVADAGSLLARHAQARSRSAGVSVDGSSNDGGSPTFFVSDEVIVAADDTDLVEYLLRQGGRVRRRVQEPTLPEGLARTGLRLNSDVDMEAMPRTIVITFPGEIRTRTDDSVLGRAQPRSERVEWTSEQSLALARLIAPARVEGRRVGLNAVGVVDSLALHRPDAAIGGLQPVDWPVMNQRSRIADAWMLFDTVRELRSAAAVEFIGICDTEFFSDPTAAAGTWQAATFADIGGGMVQWNSDADSAGLPAPTRGDFHGLSVASTAAAALGNNVGVAGSGGLVARPAFFSASTQDGFLTTIIRCTQWGIRTVNASWGIEIDEDDLVDRWFDTLQWATANGTLMICSAGNEGRDLGTFTRFPTNLNAGGLTVGALDPGDLAFDDGTWASNHGGAVHLWAPGYGNPVVANPTTMATSQFAGTSAATPLVSGVAAMVRAVNPSLTVAERRQLLIDTGWVGSGRVARGLDAYAAVWAAAKSRMTENAGDKAGETLHVRSDGTFAPAFTRGFNTAGDLDTYEFDVERLSNLGVTLEWYRTATRSGDVVIQLWDVAADTLVPGAVVNPVGTTGHRLTAVVGPGRYRLALRGYGPSPTLIGGALTSATLIADPLEPNDTFEDATPLRVLPIGPWKPGGPPVLVDHRAWGPGDIDLTLHSNGGGSSTSDVDFFVVDTPSLADRDLRAAVQFHASDGPITVTLFDADRTVVREQPLVRDAAFDLTEGTRAFLKVEGSVQTRYWLWIGRSLKLDEHHLENHRRLDNWWEDPHPEWIDRLEADFGVLVTPEILDDGALTVGAQGGMAVPAGVSVALLDAQGTVVRVAERTGRFAVVDVAGLDSGPYALRVTTPRAVLRRPRGFGIALQPPADGFRQSGYSRG